VFITLEGIEGCGKTTQTHLLANWLRENKFSVVLTYEPGDTDLGNSIRSLILDSHIDLSPNTELFLYLADRIEHVRKVIKPALKGGKIVLSSATATTMLLLSIKGMEGEYLLNL